MAASNTLVPLVLANLMALMLLDDISMILYFKAFCFIFVLSLCAM